jgi:hypothetical protein
MIYAALIQSIRQIHSDAKAGVAGAVNRRLILRNWLIGAYIVENEAQATHNRQPLHAQP